jgi:hypothetical protein
MTAPRRRAQPPADAAVLAAVVARQGVVIARLTRAVDQLAQTVIELRVDLDEVRQGRRRTAPRGCVAIKVAAGRVGYSTACVRLWCIKHGREIGATRVGAGWYCELPKLEVFARSRRKT